MSYSQSFEQNQTYILSAKQIESMEILAMATQELTNFITDEQLSNPILELDFSKMKNGSTTISTSKSDSDKIHYDIPDNKEIELSDYLISQLPLNEMTKENILFLIKIISYIDNQTGYFSEPIEMICEELQKSIDEVNWAIQYVRKLEPAGVGAYNIHDCMCLQLERMGKLDQNLHNMIYNYLDYIAKENISKISKGMDITPKKVKEYIALIRTLNPKPVSGFGNSNANYIVPDVQAEYDEDKWNITLHGISTDSVKLNHNYIEMAKTSTDPQVITYFNEKITRAQQIINSIRKREETLKTMFTYILNIQKDYALGIGKRHSLTQKEVAEVMGVHPSTINRAVKNKYIHLPIGVISAGELFMKKKEMEVIEYMNETKQIQVLSSKVSPICIIAPTNALIKQSNIVCNRFNKQIDAFLASVPDAVTLAKDLLDRGAQILISRKGTRRMLEDEGYTTVEIDLSLSDYIPIMEKAMKVDGMVAFFSYGAIAEDIRTMTYLMGIDARYYSFQHMNQCWSVVQEAINDGAVLGIGGADSSLAAAKLGLEHLTVENSEQSLLAAINTAEQLLQLKQEEEKKAEKLKIQLERYDLVFNFTHDAIIAVDEEGKIEVLNREAEKILKMDHTACVGMPITKILPNSGIPKLLASGEQNINHLMKIRGTMVSTNRVPIVVDGKIKGAVATFQDIKSIQKSEEKIRIKLNEKGMVAKYTFSDIVGDSPEMLNLKSMAEKFARSNATILIQGETGVGKELFAQSIHNASMRFDGPFVAVNCGSLPKNILESELFGYVEGAFTGASKNGKMGLFEMAHGGTIFLDEIGEMPLETQVQLLRVLQEKEIRRLGSDRVIPVDIRIITATNRDLLTEIEEKRFREDLYYRLNVLNLQIPPLRHRKNDVELIGIEIYKSFVDCDEYEISQLKKIFLQLRDYAWPGNVREVHNLMERIYVLRSQNESFIFISEYIKGFLRQNQDKNREGIGYPEEKTEQLRTSITNIGYTNMEDLEKARIIYALQENKFEMSKAANSLQMSRSTLWRRIKKYGIKI